MGRQSNGALIERPVDRKNQKRRGNRCDLWLGVGPKGTPPREIFLELVLGERLKMKALTASVVELELDYLLNRKPWKEGTGARPRVVSIGNDGRGAVPAADSIKLPPSIQPRPLRVGLAVAYFTGNEACRKELEHEGLGSRGRHVPRSVWPPCMLPIGPDRFLAAVCAVV
ncbi:MAG: hypothetical protein HY905_25205 [Deltaproteobacteria bacterium]|nr:hypothetical protein [Deltaproteobacteria bacterium]